MKGTTFINWSPRNKYHAVRTIYNGYLYASKFEADVAANLDWRVKAGELKSVERQVRISLDINGHHICDYICDFKAIHPDGSEEFIEAKGVESDTYRMKRKLFEALYIEVHPEATYTVIKNERTWHRPFPKRFGHGRKSTTPTSSRRAPHR